MIKRFVKYYKPHMRLFLLDIVCAFALSGISLIYPVLTRRMINEFVPNRELRLMLIFAGILLLLYIVKCFFSYIVNYYGHIVGVRMQADMRRDIFGHLQKLPFTYFDNNKTGALMSRITNDLFEVSELAHHGPEDLFISAVMLLGSFVVMCTMNVWLTLIVYAFLPVMIYFAMRKRMKMFNAFTKSREQMAAVNAGLENSISGIRVSKAYTNSRLENENFEKGNTKLVKARGAAFKVMGEFYAGTGFIIDFLYVVVLLAGGLFYYYGKIDIGEFAAFLLYVSVFLSPVNRLISFVEQYQDGMTGFKRFCEIMDAPVEKDEPGAAVLGNVKGEIEFRNVGFSYGENGDESKNVLSGISFRIDAGKTLALVGPSGGGKTTICNIIPRFYDVSSGSVLIDGKDSRSYTRESLRAKIGIVSQDVFLFDATIFENIAYGRPDATQPEVYEAARLANISGYIESLPDGYNTLVGERGIKLSGGQKQRVAIARVFLKNPPILILDEATSALDNATEKMIQESLDTLCRGRTTVVVAHRLSTVRGADEIIVIGTEGIIERGKHAELLAADGEYAALYNSQFAV